MALLALLALAGLPGLLAQPPIITWASSPVQPGETLLLSGADLTPPCTASFSTTSSTVPPTTLSTPALVNHSFPDSLKFTVPIALPADVFSLTLTCNGVESASPTLLNAAEPWWVQGDGGDTGSPGGWLRVTGLTLAFLSEQELLARTQLRAAQRALSTTSPASLQAVLAAHAALAVATAAGSGATPPTVRLTPAGGGPAIDLAPTLGNATQFSLHTPLPPSLPPGQYNVSISNGRGAGSAAGAFAALDSFVSPLQPHVAGITIAPAAPWPPGVFPVTRCTSPAAWPFPPNATSDAEVQAALAAAAAAGGGTLALGPGTFFLTQPLLFPPHTRLQGAGQGATAVYFAEATPATAPAAYLALNDSAAAEAPGGVAAWGVSDLTLYVTGFHYHVLAASNYTDGFHLERVTLRANAFFASNGPGSTTHGRAANWTLEQAGNGLQVNARNWRVLNCDLHTTYNAITSFASNGKAGCNGKTWPNSCHGAEYGRVADNTIAHGGASHFMNQWRQMIYERNIMTGASVIAMGQSVGTGPDGGYDHHILHSDNTVSMVHGNDRELLTFDDAGGAYYGTLAAVSGATLTTSADAKSAKDNTAGGWAGGCAVVLSGRGAGQWRRIVTPGIGAEASNPGNRTWVLDAPFAVTPSADALVQFTPFRGRNVFSGDLWKDGGAFQYYGQALDNVLADSVGERMTGFLAWGQWRGWTPANASGGGLGGQMGNGLMPNRRNQYLRNTFTGSFSCPNYNYSVGYDPAYARRPWATQPLDNAPPGVYGNALLVYRHNSGGGGYSLGVGLKDVVVDGGRFVLDPGQVAAGGGGCALVDARAVGVYVAPTLNCTLAAGR